MFVVVAVLGAVAAEIDLWISWSIFMCIYIYIFFFFFFKVKAIRL